MTVVIEQLGTTQRALGFYETRGLIRSYRGPRGRRFYDAKQISRIRFILDMQSFGFLLSQIGGMLGESQMPVPKLGKREIAAQLERLEAQRETLVQNIERLKRYGVSKRR